MANIMTKRGSLDNIVTYEHYCDTKADLANIPENEITLGSTAIVLQDEDGALGVYIATSDKEWIAMMTTGGSSGDDDTAKKFIEKTIVGDYVIPDGVTVIGEHAFDAQYQMTSVTIPEGVQSIHGGAFHGCIGIKEIVTPESCTTINPLQSSAMNTFSGMVALEKATFPNVTSFRTDFNPQFSGSGYTSTTGGLIVNFPALLESNTGLLNGSNVSKCYFPAVTSFNGGVEGCGNLKEIYIGANCMTIGEEAFAGTSGVVINCGFVQGAVTGAPWSAENATINYNVPVPEVENE